MTSLESRSDVKKATLNFFWLFFDKSVRIFVGLFVGVALARYLGPSQFGLFNYVTAFVGLFFPIVFLGLDSIVVRELVFDREGVHKNLILGSAFLMQLFGGLLAFILSVIIIGILRPYDLLAKSMVIIFGFVYLLKSSEVIKYWFEAEVKSKYVVWVENANFVVFSIIRFLLILKAAPIIWFAWLVLLESIVVFFGLILIYRLDGHLPTNWDFCANKAKSLLKAGWPLLLSSLSVMIYMRLDQLMLGAMLGDEEVGIYSVAVRISESWYFVPLAIVSSFFPSIQRSRGADQKVFYEGLQKLFNLLVAISLAVAILMTFLSPVLISSLFGNEYSGASKILAIHIWMGLFVSLGVASGKWYLIENLSQLAFYRTLIGCVINVVLNLLLIPRLGSIGCVFATFIAYSFAALFFDAFSTKTRVLFDMKINAISLRWLISCLKKY